jgi:D-xylose 1-dehydrogenase (NADP+, D-xylono-1,5-lactone-forming)
MAQKIRWGIISTARIGEGAVIPAIQKSRNGEVVAVASRDLAKGQEFAKRLNIPKAYGSYEEMLADPDIDAVYNPLPNHLHAPLSIQAAEAGKHVLCEKPLALNAEEAQQMADAFNQRGLLLMEAFMYPFHPQTEKVKQMVDTGMIGDLRLMTANFTFSIGDEDDIRMKKDMGGGALYDVGCYCIHVMRLMSGEEPVAFTAAAQFGQRSQVDEVLVGTLTFPSGLLGHIGCSFRAPMNQSYELQGTKGRIYVEKGFVPFRPDPNAPIIIRYYPGVSESEIRYEEIRVEPADQYTLMTEDFSDAILNKRPLRFPVEYGIANMRVIDQLFAAARR